MRLRQAVWRPGRAALDRLSPAPTQARHIGRGNHPLSRFLKKITGEKPGGATDAGASDKASSGAASGGRTGFGNAGGGE